jgi:hypothetical protein
MKYEKPEVVKLESAVAAIQSGGVSKQKDALDSGHQPTNPAYEADE